MYRIHRFLTDRARRGPTRRALVVVAAVGLAGGLAVPASGGELVVSPRDPAGVDAPTLEGVDVHVSPPGTAGLTEVCRRTLDIPVEERYAEFRERVNELLADDASDAEIAAAVEQELGIVRLSPPGVHEALLDDTDNKTSADVVLYQPTFSYDRCLRKYVMAASWQWKSCKLRRDVRPCWHKYTSGTGNMGGPNGMAIRIDVPIKRVDQGIATSDNCGRFGDRNDQPDTTENNYGVGFVEQDTVRSASSSKACGNTWLAYDWHRGTVSDTFDFRRDCAEQPLTVESKMGHSWETTAVNGIGISTTGISISWSSAHHRWQAHTRTPLEAFC